MLLDVDIRVSQPDHPRVAPVLQALDDYLFKQYPVDEFPEDINHILSPAELKHDSVTFLVAWQGIAVVGCGAVRRVADTAGVYGEIKRMYVPPYARGQRLAEKILLALEASLVAQGIHSVKLESGTRQPEALRLYERCGYRPCPLFGAYLPNPVSVYMAKQL